MFSSRLQKLLKYFLKPFIIRENQLPEKEQIEETADLLFKMADPIYGGMKGTPKFPIGYQNDFMLHYSSTFKDSRSVFLVERTSRYDA